VFVRAKAPRPPGSAFRGEALTRRLNVPSSLTYGISENGNGTLKLFFKFPDLAGENRKQVADFVIDIIWRGHGAADFLTEQRLVAFAHAHSRHFDCGLSGF
jgi:hypothetical protein